MLTALKFTLLKNLEILINSAVPAGGQEILGGAASVQNLLNRGNFSQ